MEEDKRDEPRVGEGEARLDGLQEPSGNGVGARGKAWLCMATSATERASGRAARRTLGGMRYVPRLTNMMKTGAMKADMAAPTWVRAR